jgi:hypothetical protein
MLLETHLRLTHALADIEPSRGESLTVLIAELDHIDEVRLRAGSLAVASSAGGCTHEVQV